MPKQPYKKDIKSLSYNNTRPKNPHWMKKIVFIYGLIIISISLISLSGFLLCTVGMLPGLVAWAWDKSPNKRIAISVLMTNASGIAPPLIQLLPLGWSLAAGFEILSDSRQWFSILGAAGAGWLIVILTPQMIRAILIWRHENGIKINMELQQKLISTWGEKIKDPIITKQPIVAQSAS